MPRRYGIFLLLPAIVLPFLVDTSVDVFQEICRVGLPGEGRVLDEDVRADLRKALATEGLFAYTWRAPQRAGAPPRRSRCLRADDPVGDDLLWGEIVLPGLSHQTDRRLRAVAVRAGDLENPSPLRGRCGIPAKRARTALSALCDSLVLSRPPPASDRTA